MFDSLRTWRRAGTVAGPIGMEPPDLTIGFAPQGPAVLVHQLVVEAAHQDQVVQVRPASPLPPPVPAGGPPDGGAGDTLAGAAATASTDPAARFV